MRWFRAALILAVLGGGLAEIPSASAQPGPADKRGPKAGKRDRVKERIRAMRAWVLTEQLDLDAATAEKMFPVLARYDDELAKLLGERKQLREQLAVARQTPTGATIDPLLDKLVGNQRARWAAEERRFAELRTLLTPAQAAELLDVLPEVDRKILRGLRQVIDPGADSPDPPATRDRPARPRRSRGRGAAPAADEPVDPFDVRR